jgi:hypothetical protein
MERILPVLILFLTHKLKGIYKYTDNYYHIDTVNYCFTKFLKIKFDVYKIRPIITGSNYIFANLKLSLNFVSIISSRILKWVKSNAYLIQKFSFKNFFQQAIFLGGLSIYMKRLYYFCTLISNTVTFNSFAINERVTYLCIHCKKSFDYLNTYNSTLPKFVTILS